VASLSQGRTAAAQCGLFTRKSVPVIFEPPCIIGPPCSTVLLQTSSRSPLNELPNLCGPRRLITMLSPEDHRTLTQGHFSAALILSIIYPSTRISCKRPLRCRYPKQNLSTFSSFNECYI